MPTEGRAPRASGVADQGRAPYPSLNSDAARATAEQGAGWAGAPQRAFRGAREAKREGARARLPAASQAAARGRPGARATGERRKAGRRPSIPLPSASSLPAPPPALATPRRPSSLTGGGDGRASVDGGAGAHPAPAFDSANAEAGADGARAPTAGAAAVAPLAAAPPSSTATSKTPPLSLATAPVGALGYRFTRQRRADPFGWLLFALWAAALSFYLYVRVAKTLAGLGSVLGYGLALLVVECAGATTVAVYALNLLFIPVHEDYTIDATHPTPGMPAVKLPYHVRVLVPCYKESLDIVACTLTAAAAAPLPAGVKRTVYLCDDGKDKAKRAWVAAAGAGFVYVSGRTRAKGEMNGKSANLNNVCRQLYPDGVTVPGNELVCVFDADQVATSRFFARTLPLFDGGDDVAMVLSPQCFHNVDLHADIFNHS